MAHGLSLGLLLLIALATHSPLPPERFALLGLSAGAFGGVALILYYQALSLGEMGITTALTGLLTALVPVVYSFFTQGSPKSTQIAGFVLAAAAIALIAYAPAGEPRPLALGLADPGRAGLWCVSGGFESRQHARPDMAAHFFPRGQRHAGVRDCALGAGARSAKDGATLAQAGARKPLSLDRRIRWCAGGNGESALYAVRQPKAAWMWRRCWPHSTRWSRLCWRRGF